MKIVRLDADEATSLRALAKRAMRISGCRPRRDGFGVTEGPGALVTVSNRRYLWRGHVWTWAEACELALTGKRP